MIEVIATPWPCTNVVAERPIVSSLARLQARLGLSLSSLRHEYIRDLPPSMRKIITLLDGTRTVTDLINATSAPGRPVNAETIKAMLREVLHLSLLHIPPTK